MGLNLEFFSFPCGKPQTVDKLFYVVRRTNPGSPTIYEAVRENVKNAADRWATYEQATTMASAFKTFYKAELDGIVMVDKRGDVTFFDLPGVSYVQTPGLDYADAGSW